jgi:hypothetical protein
VGAIRHRGDVMARVDREGVVETERARTLSWWWFEEERRLGLHAELPAAQGAVVVRAIERMAERVPSMPGEEDLVETRHAHTLVAICSAQAAADPDPDRATVVIHAQLSGLEDGSGGRELERGTAVHPHTVRRLLCNGRVQTVIEDAAGDVVGLGRTSASRRRGCSARCDTGTGSAGSPAAAPGGSRRRTTSAGGATAVGRASRTSC